MGFLRGCREISQYVKVHPATIRRWVKTKGFPVILGSIGGTRPITSTMLIDRWLAVQSEQQFESLKDLK